MIGSYLFSHGFTGVFGVDSVVDRKGTVIPIIEINGRFTLSTYISFILLGHQEAKVCSFYKRLKSKVINYEKIRKLLKERSMWLTGNDGIFIYNSTSVDGELADGRVRMFCLVCGETQKRIDELIENFSDICNDFNVGD